MLINSKRSNFDKRKRLLDEWWNKHHAMSMILLVSLLLLLMSHVQLQTNQMILQTKGSVFDQVLIESRSSLSSKDKRKQLGFQTKKNITTKRISSVASQSKTGIKGVWKDSDTGSGNSNSLAGLHCDNHGGPVDELSNEMVYWEDIPSDSRFVSMYKKEGETKYLTFEYDYAGWNNLRMSLETLVGFAFVTGRTLVIPPERFLFMLNETKGANGKRQRRQFSFFDFYPLKDIAKEHVGLDIISTQEFLEREAITGNLRVTNVPDNRVSFPPGNQTNWNKKALRHLNEWLRQISHRVMWNPDLCMTVFPTSTDPKDLQALLDIKANVEAEGGFPKFKTYIGKPNPLNASAKDRMKENWAEFWIGGKGLCIYDETMQNAKVLHFPIDVAANVRMLVHFYAFLFFQDWRLDLWMKRFVRDHMRYTDSLQCAAARVVRRIRERARARGDAQGNYDAMHIRRGDFSRLFPENVVGISRIYNKSKDILIENATVFIASDERNRTFFEPLTEHYDLVFLSDFSYEVTDINTNQYGMIEQLVLSKARSFLGCWQSSFTNYVNRLRGYHTNRAKAPGYENGVIPSWYYTSDEHRDDMRVFTPVYQGYYYREFPTSWRLIDTGIEEMKNLLTVNNH